MTYLGYALVCPLAYVLAGGTKFAINSLRARRFAFDRIGLGSFPSTHTAIASSPAWLLAMRTGIDTPAFAVAVAIFLVVAIDAMDLRRKVGHLNLIVKAAFAESREAQALRDRVGHSPGEVAGGALVGAIAAALVLGLPGF